MALGVKMKLKRQAGPAWIELGEGAAVLVEPATTSRVFIAQAKADLLTEQIGDELAIVTMAGAVIEGLPPLETEAERRGMKNSLFAVCLAEDAIVDWRGVLDEDGQSLPFERRLVADLMNQAVAAKAFLGKYLALQHEAQAEGKG